MKSDLFDFKVNTHSPEYQVSPHMIKTERSEIPLDTILKTIKKPVLKTCVWIHSNVRIKNVNVEIKI